MTNDVINFKIADIASIVCNEKSFDMTDYCVDNDGKSDYNCTS